MKMNNYDHSKAKKRIESLPREIDVVLMAAGIANGMLPPPPGPFDMMIVFSGVLVLWPRGFRALEGRAQSLFPKTHDLTLRLLDRLLDDLERRYPESVSAPLLTVGNTRPSGDE